MHAYKEPLPAMTDAAFRIHWIAGFSAAAIAQMAHCTVRVVYARAKSLGFITPIKPNDRQGDPA